MRQRGMRRLAVGGAAAASILLVVAGSPARAETPRDASPASEASIAGAGAVPDEAAVRAYRSAQPHITVAEAGKRVRHQAVRTMLLEAWAHRHADTFGGSWYPHNPYDGGGGNDSALIRMDNAVWRDTAGGYQYHGGVSGHRVDLDYAISSVPTIAVGDVVCFNAWHSDYGCSNCGTVDIASDPANHGLTRVRGYAV